MKFASIAIISLVEAVSKLAIAIVFVETGLPELVYVAIPASLVISFLVGWFAVNRIKTVELPKSLEAQIKFPTDFFATCLLTNFAAVAFLSLDVILAKHYLAPQAAGEYALLSLSGKMVFFAGSLFVQFINPLVSRHEGAGKDSREIFYKLLTAVIFTVLVGFTVVGIFGHISIPALFGPRANPIVYLLPIYTMAMVGFVIGGAFTVYHQAKKQYLFSFVSFIAAMIQVLLIRAYHSDIFTIALITAGVGFAYLVVTTLFHFTYATLVVIARNIADFFGLFGQVQGVYSAESEKSRILIFNWYDTKHVWGGGAEIYLQEIAERLVRDGHKVTIFCGNDGHNKRGEVINGVEIVRRGGLYTVVIWGFVYYLIKFRGKYDVIIDSAKGVPFFTPLYVRKPIIGLVCHIHQEMFRTGLNFPLRKLSMFMEGKLMPFVYKKTTMLTISESSRQAMEKIGLGKKKTIQIVVPGVDIVRAKVQKTTHPSIVYLGRLRSYKSVDILIKAFAEVVKQIPEAKLTIAGDGETMKNLKNLTKMMGVEPSVKFTGRVTDEIRAKIFTKAWIAVQPSMVEGWGITNIEANVCGTPVVASNVDGLRDSIIDGKTGLLVPPQNVAVLAKVLKDLLIDQKYLGELSVNATEYAEQFSWERSTTEFLEVIDSVFKEKANRLDLHNLVLLEKR